MTEEEWISPAGIFLDQLTDEKAYEIYCNTPMTAYRQTGKSYTHMSILIKAHRYMLENNITEPAYTERVIESNKRSLESWQNDS